jgi:hypothetical protein
MTNRTGSPDQTGATQALETLVLCPRCGEALADEASAGPATRPRPPRPPRPGRRQPSADSQITLPLSGLLGALAVAVAAGLLMGGQWIAALLLVALAAALFAHASDRIPSSGPARARIARRIAGVGAGARLARVSVQAWLQGVRELLRARRRQQQLCSERREQVASLGEAVLRGDYERAASLKAASRALGAEMQEREQEAAEAMKHARERIDHERGRERVA